MADAWHVATGGTLLQSEDNALGNRGVIIYGGVGMDDMEKVADLRALLKAYSRAKRGKRNRTAAIQFGLYPMEGLCKIRWSLMDRTFQMGQYTSFSVYRPVYREVCACAFKDKIVLGSLCKNVLWNGVNPHLITDNYASRTGYGTHYALDRLEANLRRYYINYGASGYALKIDVRKYFYNLSQDAIRDSLRRYGFDDWTLWLCDVVLSSFHCSLKQGYITLGDDGKFRVVLCDMEGMPLLEIGSPIGNETSQVFAVQYLNKIDHYIKDQCGLRYYGRYMDDSYILHPSKEYLQDLLATLRQMYADIGLELNEKTQIIHLKNGLSFLGMHFYLTDTGQVIRRLKPANVRYQKVHIREDAQMVAEGKMTEACYWKKRDAWDNHASHADAKKLRRKMRKYAEEALKNAYRKKQRELGEVSEDLQDLSGGAH